jgi:glycosyltransferase involved in cell wall biosynthesis
VTAPGRPIRVLHLRDSPWVDGPGRTILETGSHLDPGRIEYHIGAFVSDAQQHPMVEGARARGLKVHVIEDAPGVSKELVGRVVGLIDELGIDVLHTSEFRSNILALICRRHRRMVLISTIHGWIANDVKGRIYRLADKFALRGFDAVICVSQTTRSLVPRWWLSDSRTHVLPNALVTGVYGAETLSLARRAPDVSRGAVLLNVGRLSPEKGQDLLLRAVAELSAGYPGLRLRFAGIGPGESDLRALARTLQIEDRVEFLGYVNDMPRLYRDIDVVVQSSLTEGMPNVILEAAFLRVPIVATRVGGTAEVIEHARSGWLIKPGSVAELVGGIRRFLEQPQEFVGMGRAAHDRIRASFSFDARTQRLMAIYESVVGSRPIRG